MRAAATFWLLTLLAGAGCGSASQQARDAAETDPDKYRVVLENERVRVLRYHDNPGDATKLHHHPDFVLYALAPFRRRIELLDGRTRERDFQAGDVIWVPAETHVGRNTGQVDTDVLIVELKEPSAGESR